MVLAEAADRPYDASCKHLRKEHRIALSKRTIENVMQTVGESWLEADRQVGQDHRDLTRPIASEFPAERCCVFADGVMAHVDGAWHEVRLGTIRSDAGAATLKSNVARLCDVESFGQDLQTRALQCGYGEAKLRAFIADGAKWIWRMADRQFSTCIQILDFYHVCEHLCQCANVLFGEGTDAATEWAWRMKGLLRAGLVDEALDELRRDRSRSNAKTEAKRQLRGYLRNNRTRMDYPRYEALGLPIGSGEVEAQCKATVQHRCKQAGMRWGRRGIEALLRVRCGLQDGRFEKAFQRWNHHLVARRKRNAA